MKNIKRNGDWIFVETNEDMTGKELKHNGSYVFAEGEATGHLHTICVPNIEDMTITKLPDGSYMVDIRKQANVTHPEHSLKKDITLSPRRYKLIQKREKDWFQLATRKVLD